MKASKIFHFVGIAGLAIALFGHSIGALMTQLDPIGNLGGVYTEMKLLQLQKKPWIVDYYDILILLNWSLSLFLLFWIGVNLLFYKNNIPQKKWFLTLNAFISLINLAFEIRYSFILPIICFAVAAFGFLGAWWFYREEKV